MVNGGYGFEVMSRQEMDQYAARYSKSFASGFSPWENNYEDMAKKTMIKRVLKYAPVKIETARALINDESIKLHLSEDMSEVENETVVDGQAEEKAA